MMMMIIITTSAIRLPKWTDGAKPQTVQCKLACFQRRSPVSLEFFGRLSVWSGSWN